MLAFHSLSSPKTTTTTLLSSFLLLSSLSSLVHVHAQDTTDTNAATSAPTTTTTTTSVPTATSSLPVTIWYQQGQGPQAALQQQPTLGGVANSTTLALPAAPTNVNPTYTLNVELTNPVNASIPIPAGFFGFSIEMSVANQILGKNSTLIQVPFLNLMANLIKRSGVVKIRVGGNTQENAVLVDTLDNGRVLEKQLIGGSKTPALTYTRDLLYMMRNISDFVNIDWYVGAPYGAANGTTPWNMDMMVESQNILGDYMIGIECGNEPDQYNFNGRTVRNSSYNQEMYFQEFGTFIAQVNANDSIIRKDLLLGPGISNQWDPDSVWDTGYLDAYNSSLAAIVVERYPADNCAFLFPNPNNLPQNPQDLLPGYLTHQSSNLSPVQLVNKYLSTTGQAIQHNKPLIMFETNTASCGGFPGISDAFAGVLWSVDYGLQLAARSFSGALFHIGGQTAFYNPFTPPPTNQSTLHQWTVGSPYYAALVVSEAIGSSGVAEVKDLGANDGSDSTPAYGIWENGALARLVFINYVDDPTGGMATKVTFNGPSGASTLPIKQLLAPTVTQKYNYTWNGQYFGGVFESDGRPMGQELSETISCTNGQCAVTVPAPGVVVVYMSDALFGNAESASFTQTGQGQEGGSMTFSTTARTKSHNTATIDKAVLATSNGHIAADEKSGGTSVGKSKGERLGVNVVMGVVGAVLGGAMVVLRGRI